MSHEWLDSSEFPFASRYFVVDGQRLHYIDEGQGEVLLFVHGTPSWSFDFRGVISRLRSDFRCVALDHIGFGLSDKPPDYDYSIQVHCDVLKRFIESNALKAITLVLHDFGGPIGLNYAINCHENVSSIVLLNSWMWSTSSDPEFRKLLPFLKSPLLPFLYLNFNFSARVLLPASFGSRKLSRKIHRQYLGPFRSKADRHGALAFARSLIADQEWFESLWERRSAIASKSVLLIWGMKDSLIKSHMLEKFLYAFPHADVIRLLESGHFPQEEEPSRVAEAIRSFLK
jgi:pimeloyl-ACP methyl ester carboxylesterase